MSLTLTPEKACLLCEEYSATITATLARLLSPAKGGISTSKRQVLATEPDFSVAKSIIGASAATLWHHLRFTHPGESIVGMKRAENENLYQWSLIVSEPFSKNPTYLFRSPLSREPIQMGR